MMNTPKINIGPGIDINSASIDDVLSELNRLKKKVSRIRYN